MSHFGQEYINTSNENQFYAITKIFDRNDKEREETIKKISPIQRGTLAAHWRETRVGRLESLRKLVAVCESKEDVVELTQNLSKLYTLSSKMYDEKSTKGRVDLGVNREILRQLHRSKEMVHERLLVADALAVQVGTLRLNSGKRKAEYYELKHKNRTDYHTLNREMMEGEKATSILGTIMEQNVAGMLWQEKKDRNVTASLLILYMARQVYVEEQDSEINAKNVILQNMKRDLKVLTAGRYFDDRDRREYAYMAKRTEENVRAMRDKMGLKFKRLLSSMIERSDQLHRALTRFENERMALIQAQRQAQLDILTLQTGDNNYLKSVIDLTQELLAKPHYFEYRQSTDQPSSQLTARIQAARNAEHDDEHNISHPPVKPMPFNLHDHFQNRSNTPHLPSPDAIKIIEPDVDFVTLWHIHLKRQQALKLMQDRNELIGLLIKTSIEKSAFLTANRTEQRESEIDENGNVNIAAIEDEWAHTNLNENQLAEFIGKPIAIAARKFLGQYN